MKFNFSRGFAENMNYSLARSLPAAIAVSALVIFTPSAFAAGKASVAAASAKTAQTTFATPSEAVAAMVDAVRVPDGSKMLAILGPAGANLVHSGDAVADERRSRDFAAKFYEAHKIRLEGDARAILLIGGDDWPMPIPMVKADGRWYFDTAQGSEEILKRRIGKNELGAMEVVRAIVDAQREYVAKDQDRNGLLEYAPKIVSTPGKHDGLYWASNGGDAISPLGALVAAAAINGYAQTPGKQLAPYYGYYYRILSRQGKNAAGGAYDYMVKGKMIGGFAVIAYPASYLSTGVMTFMVNHDGVVYEKDLGKDTVKLAQKISAFDPDETWKRP